MAGKMKKPTVGTSPMGNRVVRRRRVNPPVPQADGGKRGAPAGTPKRGYSAKTSPFSR